MTHPSTGGQVKDSRYRTSLHEASHAVVGDALGHRVRLVVVKDGPAIRGFAEHHRRTDLSPLESALDDVAIAMAGQQGELLALASGYFESVDDDDARIAERTDAALGALPPQEAQFVWYLMTDDRPRGQPGRCRDVPADRGRSCPGDPPSTDRPSRQS